jgi:hypothetical protein
MLTRILIREKTIASLGTMQTLFTIHASGERIITHDLPVRHPGKNIDPAVFAGF